MQGIFLKLEFWLQLLRQRGRVKESNNRYYTACKSGQCTKLGYGERHHKSSRFSGMWVRELAVLYLRSEEIEEKKKDVVLTEHR